MDAVTRSGWCFNVVDVVLVQSMQFTCLPGAGSGSRAILCVCVWGGGGILRPGSLRSCRSFSVAQRHFEVAAQLLFESFAPVTRAHHLPKKTTKRQKKDGQKKRQKRERGGRRGAKIKKENKWHRILKESSKNLLKNCISTMPSLKRKATKNLPLILKESRRSVFE